MNSSLHVTLAEAVDALRRGGVVMLYDGDGREAEVDFVMRADQATPQRVRWLRKNAGGLLCFVTTEDIARGLGLGFLSEAYGRMGFKTRAGYGDEPAFMGYVNHVKTRTGIRDSDRALTLRELAAIVDLYARNPQAARRKFAEDFYMPGHVPILGARLGRRWGHTELSILLATHADLPPALAIIEVLGDHIDAMPLEEAKELAVMLGLPLIRGEEVKGLVALHLGS